MITIITKETLKADNAKLHSAALTQENDGKYHITGLYLKYGEPKLNDDESNLISRPMCKPYHSYTKAMKRLGEIEAEGVGVTDCVYLSTFAAKRS